MWAGLLDGNTSLTLGKLSSGINILDVSSLSSPTKLAQLTTTGAVTAGNEIIVSSADADTTSSSTFANIAGFAIFGIVAPGSDTGTITWSNLPSSVDDVLYQTTAVGALTISSAPASLTVDTGANGAGEALSVTSTAASSDHIIVGSSTFGTTSGTTGVGDVTLKGVETVDFTAHGPSADTNFVGSVSLTPASASGSEAVTIDGGSHGVVFGDGPPGRCYLRPAVRINHRSVDEPSEYHGQQYRRNGLLLCERRPAGTDNPTWRYYVVASLLDERADDRCACVGWIDHARW